MPLQVAMHRHHFRLFMSLMLAAGTACARPRIGTGPETEWSFPRPPEISAEVTD